jgi:hypothetical protein
MARETGDLVRDLVSLSVSCSYPLSASPCFNIRIKQRVREMSYSIVQICRDNKNYSVRIFYIGNWHDLILTIRFAWSVCYVHFFSVLKVTVSQGVCLAWFSFLPLQNHKFDPSQPKLYHYPKSALLSKLEAISKIVEWVRFLLRFLELQSSDLGYETGYPDWRHKRFSSVPSGKCWYKVKLSLCLTN